MGRCKNRVVGVVSYRMKWYESYTLAIITQVNPGEHRCLNHRVRWCSLPSSSINQWGNIFWVNGAYPSSKDFGEPVPGNTKAVLATHSDPALNPLFYFILSPVFSSWIKIWLLSTYNTLQVLAFDLYRNADSFLKTTWNILSPTTCLFSCPVLWRWTVSSLVKLLLRQLVWVVIR